MMKRYETVEIDIITIEQDDVIITSPLVTNGDVEAPEVEI